MAIQPSASETLISGDAEIVKIRTEMRYTQIMERKLGRVAENDDNESGFVGEV